MKKLILFTVGLTLSFSGIQAQSLIFLSAPAADSVIAVDLIPNQGTAEEGEYKIYFNLINTTNDTVTVQADRLLNDMTPGHGSFFCWDLCYDSTGTSSVTPIDIYPADTTRFGQYLILRPNGKPGISEVVMRFTNIANGEDFAEVTYKFNVGGVSGVEDLIDPRKALGLIYPNPASAEVFVPYELPLGVKNAQIVLYNLIGQKVKTQKLNGFSGISNLKTESLKSGIYFLYLNVDGRDITSRKIVISR
ncbi:MAG: T9SS type A sorting domain-containing protein [Bacteroidia bacterium]|nr:T9SS type A sorting domain-containing protein [Bacteroidia bacterium]